MFLYNNPLVNACVLNFFLGEGDGVLMLDVQFIFLMFQASHVKNSLQTFDRGSYVPAFIPIPSNIGFGWTLSCTSINAWGLLKWGSLVAMLCWVIDIWGVCFDIGVSWSLAFQTCVKFIKHFLVLYGIANKSNLNISSWTFPLCTYTNNWYSSLTTLFYLWGNWT